MINVKVHRGLHQIGGCITELSTGTSRVFIDMGQNLPGTGQPTTPQQDEAMVRGLFAQNRKTHQAVLYTHGHIDHIGLFMHVPGDVPQYMSEGTRELVLARYRHMAKGHRRHLLNELASLLRHPAQCRAVLKADRELIAALKRINTWHQPAVIRVGDITVTPFPCNHSIYDPSMFLIEGGGERVWHTGDFRTTGFTGDLAATLAAHATGIGTLIIEGTMLNRPDPCITELQVSDQMAQVMSQRKYVFVLCSATDIDRLAGVQRACRLAGKPFYAGSKFLMTTMRLFTRRAGGHSELFRFKPVLYDYEDQRMVAAMRHSGFVLALGAGASGIVWHWLQELDPSQVAFVYSAWPGYYQLPEQVAVMPAYKRMRDLFASAGSLVTDIHTSGHADCRTLCRVIEAVNPSRQIIGIHKEPTATLTSLPLPADLKRKIVD